jgi:hypothetical protein
MKKDATLKTQGAQKAPDIKRGTHKNTRDLKSHPSKKRHP